jgi:DNA-directed RNA polymerase subunit RPC12/RpoP
LDLGLNTLTLGLACIGEKMARRRSDKIWWNKPCVKCGYNLRGLRGDPVRCPECGFLNPRTRQRRIKSRTNKKVCQLKPRIRDVLIPAVGVGVGVAVATMFWLPLGAVGTVFAAVVWWQNVRRFRRACESRPGWLRGLIAYHLAAAPWLAIAVAALIASYQEGSLWAVAHFAKRWGGRAGVPAMLATMFFGAWGRSCIAKIMELRVYESIVQEKLEGSEGEADEHSGRSGPEKQP